MSKPLVLNTYPLAFPNADGTLYLVGSGASVYAPAVVAAKRFTDVELAAETHAATLAVYRRKVHGDGTPESIAQTTRTIDHMATINRFATLPHYDEEQS